MLTNEGFRRTQEMYCMLLEPIYGASVSTAVASASPRTPCKQRELEFGSAGIDRIDPLGFTAYRLLRSHHLKRPFPACDLFCSANANALLLLFVAAHHNNKRATTATTSYHDDYEGIEEKQERRSSGNGSVVGKPARRPGGGDGI